MTTLKTTLALALSLTLIPLSVACGGGSTSSPGEMTDEENNQEVPDNNDPNNADPNNAMENNAMENNAEPIPFDGTSGDFVVELNSKVQIDRDTFTEGVEYALNIDTEGNVTGDICTLDADTFQGMNYWSEGGNEQALRIDLDGTGRIRKVRYFPEEGIVGEFQFVLTSAVDSLAEIAGDYTLEVTSATGDHLAVGDTVTLSVDAEGNVTGDLTFGADQRGPGADINDKRGDFQWQKMEMAGFLEQLFFAFDLDSGELAMVTYKVFSVMGNGDYVLELQ